MGLYISKGGLLEWLTDRGLASPTVAVTGWKESGSSEHKAGFQS